MGSSRCKRCEVPLRHRHQGLDLADTAIATGLDVVALRAEVLAATALELHGFTGGAGSWISHHEERVGRALADCAEPEKDCDVVRSVAFYATLLSVAWSAGLTALAAVGNTWILDRVAGGYFEGDVMPIALRIVYAGFTLLLLGVAWLAWRYHSNTASR